MPTEPSAGPRNALLAVALVGVVAACGAAGVFFSREVSHAATIAPAGPLGIGSHASRPNIHAPKEPRVEPVTPPKAAPLPAPPASEPSTADETPGSPVPLTADSSGNETPGQVTDDKEVRLALERWQKAMLTNDSAEIAPSYARSVNRFFLKTKVSRDFVRDYLERDEERGTRLTRYDMESVSIRHLKQNEVEVDFRANFSVSTPENDHTGDTRTTLMLRREEGDWKIIYERDFNS